MARIKKGDHVVVIAGKEKNKKGTVLEVLGERVRIEGLMPIKKHVKPGKSQKNPQGGIVDDTGSIHMSNVLPIDPKTKKGTRIHVTITKEGKKVRVTQSGEMLA